MDTRGDETVFLIPLDGSAATEQAVRRAAPIIRRCDGASVRLLAVLDPAFLEIPLEVVDGMDLEPSADEVYRNIPQAQHVMDRATRILAEHHVNDPERLYRTGKPYETILAEAHRADILVMHRLDASGFAEKLRGSMTERLARHAPCHVWLVDPRER